jgi:hypothetical protein
MRKTDLAWAAGIIDGEGALMMTRARPGVNRRKTMGYQIRVSVRMTHLPTIERLGSILGGIVKQAGKVKCPSKHRQAYEWIIFDADTECVLPKLLPYLTTKVEQAKLLLEFRNVCFPPVSGTVPPKLEAKRTEYFNRLAVLNKRGPQ